MSAFRDIPIGRKLILIIMATCSVAMILGTIALGFRYAAAEQDNLATRMAILAKVAATNSASALAFNDPDAAGRTLTALDADPAVIGAEVRDARGQRFAQFHRPQQGESGRGPAPTRADPQAPGSALTADRMQVVQAVVLDGEPIGTIVIEVDLRPLRAALLRDAAMIALVVLAAGLIALLLATRLQKVISDPIGRLAETMRHVSVVKDYSRRVASAGNDEFGALVRGFNEMLDQIQLRDEALQRSREQLVSAQRIARLGNWEWNAVDGRVQLSSEARRVLGLGDEPEAISIDSFLARVHEADREGVGRALRASLSTGAPFDVEHRIAAPDGAIEFVHQRGQACGAVAEGAPGFAGTVQNVSEIVKARDELLITASALENTADAVAVLDSARRLVWINKAFTDMTAFGREDVLGQPVDLLRSDRHSSAFHDGIWQHVAAAGNWRGEVWGRRKNGDVFPQRLSISRIVDRSGQASHYVCVSSDISHYKQYEARLEYLAHHDAITQLPNRVQFETRLPEAIARATRAATLGCVMFIDLDDFKAVNDSRGHADGDRLLRAAAGRIRKCVRASDVVARIGGDEFAVLLEGLSRVDDAAEVAAKLVSALATPFDLGGPEIRISGSIGLSCYPNDGTDAHILLDNADRAMYLVKQQGRNGYRFFAEAMPGAPTQPRTLDPALTQN